MIWIEPNSFPQLVCRPFILFQIRKSGGRIEVPERGIGTKANNLLKLGERFRSLALCRQRYSKAVMRIHVPGFNANRFAEFGNRVGILLLSERKPEVGVAHEVRRIETDGFLELRSRFGPLAL